MHRDGRTSGRRCPRITCAARSSARASYVHDASCYVEHDIELRLDRTAVSLDTSIGQVALDDGERLRYARLLLATGAEPRRLSIPGEAVDGVLYLRSVEDSDALRERLDRGGSVVVVGAGWIGAEVAASARQRGLDVTVIAPGGVPLERVLGAEVGAIYRDIHTDHGVRMLLGTHVAAFEGVTAVERVRTGDGRTLECDFVVVGVGAQPRTVLASQGGVYVGDGIVVDEQLQTSVPGVFAAGDVAMAHDPLYGRGIRVEHWANALRQGPVAARSMLGRSEAYDRVPIMATPRVASERAPARRRFDEPRTRASTSPPSPRSSSATACARSATPTRSRSTASRPSSREPLRQACRGHDRPGQRARPSPARRCGGRRTSSADATSLPTSAARSAKPPTWKGSTSVPPLVACAGKGEPGHVAPADSDAICGRLGLAPLPPDYDALARVQADARAVVESVTTDRGSCPVTAAPLFESMRAALAAAGLREWRVVAPDQPERLLQSCRAEIDARTRTVTIYHSDPVTRMYAPALGKRRVLVAERAGTDQSCRAEVDGRARTITLHVGHGPAS